MSHFFAYMARMKYIKRWSLMNNSNQENIQEHSLQVAMIAHSLVVIENTIYNGNIDASAVAVLAMYHEAGEVITGDLPTPIKYFNPSIKQSYKEIEAIACENLLSMLPTALQSAYKPLLHQSVDSPEGRIVKYADKICAYLKCVEELRMGNAEFSKAKKTIESELAAIQAPEVQYFLKEFVPSFELTLDEMG